jgi:hypothetical protein
MGDGLPTTLGDIYIHVSPCAYARLILDFVKRILVREARDDLASSWF